MTGKYSLNVGHCFVLAFSSYFYHRDRVKMADKYIVLRQTITDIFELNHRCYGYRRLQASLTRQCITYSSGEDRGHFYCGIGCCRD